ncbi:MAG TPA: PAS domain-containing protein [Bacteroidota bacterium]|nr:PAS domain-containing protein [Bacteroidota bacterium]
MNRAARSQAFRLAVSLSIPLIAAAIQWTFWSTFQPHTWILFYPAVFFASWIGGLTAGLAATLLSAMLANWFFVLPLYSFRVHDIESVYSICVFVIMGVLFSVVQERLKRTAKQTNEERFRHTLDMMIEGCQIIDFEWRYVYVNEAAAQQGKSSPSALIGKTMMEAYPGIETTPLFDVLRRCMNDRVSMRIENQFPFPGGSMGWFDLSIQPAPEGLFILSIDISKRKQVEGRLQESEHMLRLFVENAPAAIAMFDREMRYIAASRRFAADYQLKEQNIIGRSHYEIFPEISERWKEIHRRCLAGAIENAEDDPFPRADGGMDWVRWEIRPWYRTTDDIGGIILFSEVITERKLSEKQVLRMKRLYATLSQVNQTIVRARSRHELFDSFCRVAVRYGEFSLAWIGLLDDASGEITPVAASGLDLQHWPFDDININSGDLKNTLIASAVRTSKVFTSEDVQTDKKLFNMYERFQNYSYHSSAAIPFHLRGKIIGALSLDSGEAGLFKADEEIRLLEEMGLDISFALETIEIDKERRLAEQEIHTLNAELEQRVAQRTIQLESAVKELETFSYSVSHDLRAPLRAITGFSQILRKEPGAILSERGQDYLERICTASGRMAELIDDLLTLSRINRAEIQSSSVDLSALWKKVAEQLRSVEPDRRIELNCQEGLTATGDANLLHVVLENLLGNAWKFTRKKESPVIECGQTEKDGRKVFYIRDNGAGFDMKYVGKLFGAFQRLHRLDEFEGTGIGLATVARVIHRHGGEIWAEGAVDQGATFYFSLP